MSVDCVRPDDGFIADIRQGDQPKRPNLLTRHAEKPQLRKAPTLPAPHQHSTVVACSSRLNDAIEFPILDNDEAIDSGAWWFYARVGFRPRDKETIKLADAELRKAQKKGYRSSKNTLRELADHPVYFWLGRKRRDVLPVVCTDSLSLGVLDYVSNRFGSRREDAARHCSQQLADALGVDSIADWPADEQLMQHRLSPVIAAIADVQDWSKADRTALVDVIRAKGGVREKDYVTLFDAHKRLRRAVATFAADAEANEQTSAGPKRLLPSYRQEYYKRIDTETDDAARDPKSQS